MSSDTVQYYIETPSGLNIEISQEDYVNQRNYTPPDGVYVFRFYKIQSILLKSSGSDEEPFLVRSKQKDISVWYIIGKIYTLEEVQKQFPDERNVMFTMKWDITNKCVRCSNNTWYLLVDQIVLDR